MPQTQVEQYLKNLYKIYQYKMQVQQNALNESPVAEVKFPNPQGTSLSAREIALSVMNTPAAQTYKIEPTKAPENDSNPILNLGREIINSGPVKTGLDYLSRPSYGVGGIFEALTGTEDKKDHPGIKSLHELGDRISNIPGEFWQGLAGHDHTSVSEVMNRNPDQAALPGPVKFAEGLVADVATDPTSYIPDLGIASAAGKAAKLGIKATGKVGNAAIDAAVNTALTVADLGKKNDTTKTIEKVAETAPTTAETNPLQEALQKVPMAAHPNLDTIDAPFKVTETSKEVPTSTSPTLSVRRAIKAALLQTDEHQIGNHRLGDLLRVAKENPEKQGQIDKLINAEVNRIFTSKDYGALYKGKKISTALQFLNKNGNVIGGLNLTQLNKLFKDGIIGTGKVGDDALDLPIHDPEDLDAFHLRNAKGETVSLKQYLQDLGMGIKSGDKEILKATPKTIVEKTVQSPSIAESVSWLTKHAGKLSGKELQYLVKASPDEFEARLKELKAKTVVKSFNTPDEFAQAVKTGLVPLDAADSIYKATGVKNLDEFVEKANKVIKTTGKPDLMERLTEADMPQANAEWETPATLIDKAAQGDTTALNKAVPDLTNQIVEDLSHALPHAIVENLIDPKDISKYPYLTKLNQAKRTEKVMYQGRARNLHGWHSISQTDVFRTLAKRASLRHNQTGLKGKDFASYARMRANLMYNDILPALRVAEVALKDKGIKFISGNQESGIMMSLVDVLDSLGPENTKKWLFGIGKNRPQVLPTMLMDAAELIAKAQISKGDLALAQVAAEKLLATGPRMSEAAAKRLTVDLVKHSLNLMQRISSNYATESIKMGEAVKSMSDVTIDRVIKTFTDPNVSMGEALGEISQRVNFASAMGRTLKAPNGATPVARGIIDAELSERGVDAQGLVEADTAKAFESTDAKTSKKVGSRQQASRAVAGLDGANGTVEDLSDIMDVRMQAGLFRANVPLFNKVVGTRDELGRMFISSFGHQDLHEMVHINRNVTQSFARMHRHLMQTTYEIAHKTFGTQASARLAEAFKHLQSGDVIDDPAMKSVMDSMQSSLNLLFKGSGKGHGAFAARNGLFAEHLNEVMRKYGVPKEIVFDETKPLVEQINSWRTWTDVKDPLDILDKVHAAFQRATIDVTIGRDFSDVAHEWVSNVAKPGFVKLTDSKGKSSLFKFVDDSKFYDADIVKQLPYLENVLNGSFVVHDRVGLFSLYDTVLHAWKAGVTIYRPGHHVRNLIGDLGLSFLAGVYNPGAYKSAARILSGRASAYKEWDAFAALQAMEKGPVAAGASKLRVSIGNKRVAFDDDTLWRAAFKQGVLPDYSVLEDIVFNDSQTLKLGGVSLTKPFGGRVQKAAGGLSQARDHWVRMAHFVDVLQKGNYRSFEEAVQKAGATVRKWHPDGSDLTAFERQVMRRVIPFYSWFRKAIPLVVEAMVMHPGRALVVPKAMSGFAQSMGVDIESLYNPFPQDQLFPNWLQDNTLGPQWKGNLGIPGFGQYEGRYYGSNPGDPVTDLGNSYLGSDPVSSILGGVTPAAKIPLELATGHTLGTGANIGDTSDYIDSQIPGISQVANITNTSVTGTDPQQDVQRGQAAPGMDQVALANFLTGLGIKDYSKPNYIKSAQFELRDRLRGR